MSVLDKKKFDDESGEDEKHAKLAALDHIGGILERGMSTGLNVHEVSGDGNPRNIAGPSTASPDATYLMGTKGEAQRSENYMSRPSGLTKPPGVHITETSGENLNPSHMVERAYGKNSNNIHEVSGDGNPNNAEGASTGDGGVHDDYNAKQAKPASPMHFHKVGAAAGPGEDDPEAQSDEDDRESGHGTGVGQLASETGKAMVDFLKKNKHIR